MKPNMGNLDRTIRVMAAIAVGILYFTNAISGTTALILLGLAGIMLLTSMISFCPLYLPFGISTRRKVTKTN